MNTSLSFPIFKITLVTILFWGCREMRTPLSAQPTIFLSSKITGLSSPIQVVNAGDGNGRLFVVEKGGLVKVFSSSYAPLGTFLSLSGISTNGEQGLLSIAFHPNYASNGFFWVYYVNGSGNLELARFKVSSDPNVADAASKVVVLTISHPTNANHNGGELHFGTDGYLYLSTGDGGGGGDTPNNSQNTSSLLGKLLRLDVNTNTSPPYYTVPAGNPFSNEVFCLGLRNPFRWSFDPLNGNLWIGDVGQNAWEEIDERDATSINGTNFGWRCYEGDATYNTTGCGPMSNYYFPVYVYPTSGSSIIGGEVYRGSLYPDMVGMYVGCDYYSGDFYKIISNGTGGWTTTVQPAVQINVADFGVSEAGEMFAVGLGAGTVWKVQSNTLPLELLRFTARRNGETVDLDWESASESDLGKFEVEFSTDGKDFREVGVVAAENNATGAAYQFHFEPGAAKSMFFRLKMIDLNGKFSYSNVVSLEGTKPSGALVFPTVIENKRLVAHLESEFDVLEFLSTDGRILFSEKIAGQTGRVEFPLDGQAPGIYYVRFKSELKEVTERVVLQ